jgi:hypothetical protein
MISLRNNAPRRYFVDATGRRVLIGLTLEETFEFERLDSKPSLDQAGGQILRDQDVQWPTGEQRWLELYEKHDGAWRVWMAESRAERTESFNFY